MCCRSPIMESLSTVPLSNAWYAHLDTDESDPSHLQKEQPVVKTPNIGFTVRACQIANWDIDDSQSQHGSGKQQLKISEWIEVTEITAPPLHAPVVGPGH
jgi:hypothetical protein